MIKTLFFINLRALGSNFMKGSGNKKTGGGKIFLLVLLVLYIAAVFVGMLAMFFHSLLEPFFTFGIGWLYFALLGLIAFGISVVGTIFTASAQIFAAKDNELLLSMPIKPSAILMSRLLVLLSFEYALTTVVMLPAFVLWLFGGYATAAGIIFFIMGVLLLPLMAMAAALLLAWILGTVSSRLRHKNIITLVLAVGFMLAYFYIMTNIQGYLGELVTKGAELAEAFRRAIPPLYAFGQSVAEGSAGSAMLFILWAVLPFAMAVVLVSRNYRKILITNRGGVKTVYKEKAVKASGALPALIRKELVHFWSKPFIILNSSIGSLFMLIFAVMVLVKKEAILSIIVDVAPMFGNLSPIPLMAVSLAILGVFNILSASLISLEGKSLWIAKSIPVPIRTIITSKVCTHLIVSGLPCLVASICAIIAFADGVTDCLIILLPPQVASALMAVCGVAVNLNHPKLEWTNEIYAVKQGASAMITMFGAMGLVVGLSLVYAILLQSIVTLTVFLWICTAVFAVAIVFIYSGLMKSGVRKFQEL
ncbi:MAG: hypothetical protein LBU41_00560 [Clostridiales Family XIII bacterium]|nr:hypothetical protein [Clostridiales Family XIII bacterium]